MNFLPCNNNSGDGLSASVPLIKEGDCVIVYEGMNSMKAVYVTAKGRFENRFGIFKHQSWIGKPFGSKVTSNNQGATGWVLLLRPSPELWTQVLRHRTQILYLADISMVVMHLDLQPGSVVLESGTGSGSLTHSLVRAVAPSGHVHTFEFHAGRAEDAAAEFKQHGLQGLVTVRQRNIEELGFPDTLHGCADGVFLDLPAPYKAVASAAACLRPNGRFCSFSPCIEQVQRTAEALSAAGFTDLVTLECLLREYEVTRETLATGLQLADGPLIKRRRTDNTNNPNAANMAQPRKPEKGEAAAAAAAAPGQEAAGVEGEAEGAKAATEEAQAAAEGSAPTAMKVEEGAGAEGAAEEELRAGGGTGCDGRASPAAADRGAEGSCSPQSQQQQGGGQGFSPGQQVPARRQSRHVGGGAVGLPDRVRVVGCRPSVEARGHTGYLIFARKFVCG